MTALTEQRIIGIRSGDRVLVPAPRVGPRDRRRAGARLRRRRPGRHGRVVDAGWPRPTEQHPLDHPFAFALIQLDGADTTLVHAVDAGSIDAMATGMRVAPALARRPASATSPTSRRSSPVRSRRSPATTPGPPRSRSTMMDYDASITYTHAGHRRTRVARRAGERRGPVPRPAVPGVRAHLHRRPGLLPGRLDRARPPSTRSTCPQPGTITNYTIITPVQYPGQTETEPFARVHVLLDGTDVVLGYQTAHRRARTTRCASACGSRRCGRRRPSDRTSPRHAEGRLVGWMPTGEPDVDDPDLVNRIC